MPLAAGVEARRGSPYSGVTRVPWPISNLPFLEFATVFGSAKTSKMPTNTPTEPPEETGEAAYDFNFMEWPFYWLARADRSYLSILETALARRDLDIASWRVLMILHARRSASVSEIAEHSIVKLSTMTKIIQRMQAAGLVTNHPSKSDGRITMVTITPRARKRAASPGRAARIMERLFEDFTEVEQQLLVALLKKLSDALGRY